MSAGYFSPDVAEVLRLLRQHHVRYVIPPNRIDFKNEIDGVSFDECWARRADTTVAGPGGEQPVSYIGLADLVRNKEASGREQDRDDLRYLRRLSG